MTLENSANRKKVHSRIDGIILSVMALVLAVAHVWWLHIDTRPQPSVDSNSYLINLFLFLDGELTRNASLIDGLLELSRSGRPPLYTISAMPFVVALGRNADAALLLNLLIFLTIVFATYAIGAVTHSRKAGLLGAFVVAAMPPIIGMSRIFLPHIATVAVVAVAIAVMQHMLKVRTVRSAWLFGFCLGFAALVHPKALYFLALPAAAALLYTAFFQNAPRAPSSVRGIWPWLTNKLRDRFVLRGLIPLALIVLVVAGAWYLPNIGRIIALVGKASDDFSDVTHGFDDTARSVLWFLQTSPHAISWPYVILSVIALAPLVASRSEAVYTLLTSLLLMYIAQVSVPGAFAWMNGATMLPILAALIGVATFVIPTLPFIAERNAHIGTWLAALYALMVILAGVFTFSVSTFPLNATLSRYAALSGSSIDKSPCSSREYFAYCPNPPLGGNWSIADTVQMVAADEDCATNTCTLAVQGRPIDAYPYAYEVVKNQLSGAIEVVSETTKLSNVRADKYDWMFSDYVVYDPTVLGAMRGTLTSDLPSLRDTYRTVADFVLPDGTKRRLAKRSAPMTPLGAAQISLLDLLWADQQMHENTAEMHQATLEEFLSLAESDPAPVVELLENHVPFDKGDTVERIRRQTLEYAIAAYPDSFAYHTKLGQSYLALGRQDAALEQAQIAFSLESDDATLYSDLGFLLSDLEQPERAIAAWRDSLALDPSSPEVCFFLARALEDSEPDEASALYATCAELDPASEYAQKSSTRLGQLLVEQGDKAYKAGKVEDAIVLLGEAVKLLPNDAKTRLALAKAYQKDGRISDAIEQTSTAAELTPNQAAPLFTLGNLFLANDQTDEAIAAWRQALELNADRPDVCYRLGVLLEAKDLELAVEQFRSCTALDSENSYVQKSSRKLAQLGMSAGAQALEAGDISEAIALLEDSIARDPDNAAARADLAKAYRKANRTEEAIEQVTRALEFAPDNAAYLALLGRLYQDNNQLQDAISTWQSALAIQPDMPDICYRIGTAYEPISMTQAIAQYESCIEQHPKSSFADKAQLRLDSLLETTQSE